MRFACPSALRRWPLLGGVLALAGALAPRPARAACGIPDPGGCVDGALYNFWQGLASFGWAIDRTLLVLAYQLDAFRWWLVEVAFTSAYQVLVGVVDPLLAPLATLAVILAGLAALLLPLLGHTRMLSLRHALVWALLAPLCLTLSGPLIVQLEGLRSGVGAALFDGVRAVAPGAIFGPSAQDMAAPALLYPSSPCGSTLSRHHAGGLQLDDLAAALLWADAEDIHCPERGGPSPDLPDQFFVAAPDGPGYARASDVSALDPGTERTAAVQGMQRGAIRTLLGVLPSALAVLGALIQLVFALCLVALWVGLPIGLLFVFFAETAGGVTGLARRCVAVLQVSWSSSVVLGLLTACLTAAAELHNAGAYTGFALGGLVLIGYLLLVATDMLRQCLRTLNDTLAAVTGLSAAAPLDLAGAALGAGAALATGGASAAVLGAAALRQTGSGRYAAGAVLGHIRPLAQLGEVAASMGWGDDAMLGGLHTGSRNAAGGWRGTRTQLLADAQRVDADGRTLRERAQERAVARQLAQGSRPTVVQELGDLFGQGQRLAAAARQVDLADTLTQTRQWLPDQARRGWERVRAGWHDVTAEADTRSGGASDPLHRAVALAQVLDERLRPIPPARVLFLDERRRLRTARPPAAPPDDTQIAPRGAVPVARLLTQGYAVHPQTDGSVRYWRHVPTPSDATPDVPVPPPTDREGGV